MLRATLEHRPTDAEVGLGSMVFLEGELETDDRPEAIELVVGGNRAQALTIGVPSAGDRLGSRWWQAIVPLAPVSVPQGADVSIRVHARGGGTTELGLGSLVLNPGEPPSANQAAGEMVAICMATHEPPPDLFGSQIESIRAQTHTDWVCLISDDGSSEDARAEIERAIAGDPRFRFEAHPERVGIYRNFERALRDVPPGARYVALSDQDDRWHPDKLASLVAALGPDDVLAHSDARIVAAGGDVLAPTFWPRGRPRDDRLADLLFANPVSGSAALFRCEALRFVLPFPALAGSAFHDRWIALVCAALGGIAYVDRPLYDYVQHEAAAHGHRAAVGAAGPPPRERLTRLAAGHRPNWREAHDQYLLRCVSEAIVLRLRLGARMSAREARAVRRIEALTSSPSAQARVALRWLARAPRRRPGLEGALLRALAWRRLAPARSALSRHRRTVRTRPTSAGHRPRARDGTLRYGLTVTQDDPAAGFGDLFTARELGAALEATGQEVAYLDLSSRAWRRRARSVDVIVALVDRFPLYEVPDRAVTVAWVRNWCERWLSRDWFGDYDHVFASSAAACDRIRQRSPIQPELLPLATNPQRFRPVEPDSELQADVVFVGSYWGVERDVASALPPLAAAGLTVKVFGHGWDVVPGMRELSQGPIRYEDLARVYSSAKLVVDDSAPHTRQYGSVNARVFDALACGTLVATNDPAGAAALFGQDLPSWRDPDDLAAHADLAARQPDRAEALARPLRQLVLAEHTYQRRAEVIQKAVARSAGPRPTA